MVRQNAAPLKSDQQPSKVAFSAFCSNFDNCRSEVAGYVIFPDVVVERVGTDVHVKFGDSRSNSNRDIRAAHFVMDDERMTADASHEIRQNTWRFS